MRAGLVKGCGSCTEQRKLGLLQRCLLQVLCLCRVDLLCTSTLQKALLRCVRPGRGFRWMKLLRMALITLAIVCSVNLKAMAR